MDSCRCEMCVLSDTQQSIYLSLRHTHHVKVAVGVVRRREGHAVLLAHLGNCEPAETHHEPVVDWRRVGAVVEVVVVDLAVPGTVFLHRNPALHFSGALAIPWDRDRVVRVLLLPGVDHVVETFASLRLDALDEVISEREPREVHGLRAQVPAVRIVLEARRGEQLRSVNLPAGRHERVRVHFRGLAGLRIEQLRVLDRLPVIAEVEFLADRLLLEREVRVVLRRLGELVAENDRRPRPVDILIVHALHGEGKVLRRVFRVELLVDGFLEPISDEDVADLVVVRVLVDVQEIFGHSVEAVARE
eukprot:scaffold2453_cov72-Phaeocystis_antarctica.AAC.3